MIKSTVLCQIFELWISILLEVLSLAVLLCLVSFLLILISLNGSLLDLEVFELIWCKMRAIEDSFTLISEVKNAPPVFFVTVRFLFIESK